MNIKNINGALFAMALVAAGAGFTSCEDEPDKYEVTGGTPTIDYVRPVDAASQDSPTCRISQQYHLYCG